MTKDTKFTPKASLVFKNVDGALNLADRSSSGVVNIKHKVDSTTLGLSFTDATCRNVTSLKHVKASVEQRFGPKVALNGEFSFDDKSWKAGGKWEGKIGHKKLTLDSVYHVKTDKLTTKASLIVRPHHTATIEFDKTKAVNAKYSFPSGGITYEPSYNLVKKGFILTATKKRANQSFKLSYDFKDEKAGFEWSKRPYKLNISAPASHTKLGKATIGLHWEHDFLV